MTLLDAFAVVAAFAVAVAYLFVSLAVLVGTVLYPLAEDLRPWQRLGIVLGGLVVCAVLLWGAYPVYAWVAVVLAVLP